jgi:uncharacterized protein (DUF58 family)
MTARVAGWLGGAIALAALLFAMPSLYVPGIGLLALALGTSTWVRLAAKGASVEQTVERPMVVEGDPLGAHVTTRPGKWPLPGGELECEPLRLPLAIGSRLGTEERIERTFERRGRHQVPAPVLHIRDPLRLAERRITGRSREILVLPRIEQVRHLHAEGGGQSRSRSLRGGAEENEIDGLRPYRSGAPASRIHWPAVARLGDLVERRLISEADATPLVVLDGSTPASEDALDKAVRAAGSLCRTLASGGGCRLLLPGENRPTLLDTNLRGWPALWARLAVVGPSATPTGTELPRSVTTLFWVTARPGAARSRLVADAAECFVVRPGISPAGRATFTVAGCTGRRVRRALGRVA